MRAAITAVLVAFGVACFLVAGALTVQAQSTGEAIFAIARPFLIEIASVVIAGFVAWLVAIVRTKAGIEIEARHREALQTALTNAAGLLVARTGGAAAALDLKLGAPALQEGVGYVLKATPDAMAYFGLTPSAVAEKLQAKLGVLAAPAPATN